MEYSTVALNSGKDGENDTAIKVKNSEKRKEKHEFLRVSVSDGRPWATWSSLYIVS